MFIHFITFFLQKGHSCTMNPINPSLLMPPLSVVPFHPSPTTVEGPKDPEILLA
jgi:hypothetical protein